MAIAIRKKDGKFYSPSRDVNNWFSAAIRASLRISAEVFKDDQQALERLQQCAKVLGEAFNNALAGERKTVIGVLAGAADRLEHHPAEFSVLARSFMMIVLWRFVAGAREASDTPELSEREMELAMTDAAMLATLPDDLAAQVEKVLRLSGQWPAPAFDLPALFAEQAESGEESRDLQCQQKTQ
jgi:hypothetical protein